MERQPGTYCGQIDLCFYLYILRFPNRPNIYDKSLCVTQAYKASFSPYDHFPQIWVIEKEKKIDEKAPRLQDRQCST
jgi:hypothetical protein